MAKQDSVSKVHLNSFDDLFETDESREDLKRERLMEIPISLIHDFPDHPYKVKDDENMFELVESIKTRGLIQPVLVRPLDDGTYKIVQTPDTQFEKKGPSGFSIPADTYTTGTACEWWEYVYEGGQFVKKQYYTGLASGSIKIEPKNTQTATKNGSYWYMNM